ncbi:hypothetical protein EUGRSUZ_L02515 [Eucalyptus grandis]|uniref:Uncharacterized protein n=1 Tax=Eucalyptus grandis TaxID=71139 RepID=A0A058ZQN7_EUCGR|nr:hypothetical protein EUGRSUZ_L02515 [Eucalyptus grandis]
MILPGLNQRDIKVVRICKSDSPLDEGKKEKEERRRYVQKIVHVVPRSFLESTESRSGNETYSWRANVRDPTAVEIPSPKQKYIT